MTSKKTILERNEWLPTAGWTKDGIEKSMDEYAKEMAVGFAIWLNFNGWVEYDEPDRWICPSESNTLYSTEQLFQKYQNTLK